MDSVERNDCLDKLPLTYKPKNLPFRDGNFLSHDLIHGRMYIMRA